MMDKQTKKEIKVFLEDYYALLNGMRNKRDEIYGRYADQKTARIKNAIDNYTLSIDW